MEKRHVIFLCTANSARSQIAEAFLRKYGGDRFEAHSAGLEPTQVNPLTVQVMEEVGIALDGHYAKSTIVLMPRLCTNTPSTSTTKTARPNTSRSSWTTLTGRK